MKELAYHFTVTIVAIINLVMGGTFLLTYAYEPDPQYIPLAMIGTANIACVFLILFEVFRKDEL